MPERAVNKNIEAKVTCLAPDVCLTPMGSSMVPVPYTITAHFNVAEDTAPKVNYGGLPAFTMASRLPRVEGDEQGTGGGIISKVNLGYCRPVEHSGTVKAHGQYVVRQGDLMHMNCNGPDGPANTFGRIEYIGAGSVGDVSRETLSKESNVTVDDQTGRTVVEERVVTRDPRTGAITEARQRTEIDPTTGAIQTHNKLVTTDPSGAQTYETTSGKFNPASRNFSVESSVGKASADDFEIAENEPALLSDSEYQAGLREQADVQAEIDAINRELVWEGAKTAADIAGFIDPTPISDTVAAGMALRDSDIAGAGLSLLSWIPYLGDALAKPIKGARTTARVAKLMQRLEKLKDRLKKAQDVVKKAKDKISDALRRKGGGGKPNPKKPESPGDGGHVPRQQSSTRKLSHQKQKRHIKGTEEWKKGGKGGYFNSEQDAQKVLDAYDNGSAKLLGTTSEGHTVVEFKGANGFNNNRGAGYIDQPTNIYMIKGNSGSSPSVVPINPNWKP